MRKIDMLLGIALLAGLPLIVAAQEAPPAHRHGPAAEAGQAGRPSARMGRDWTRYPLIVAAPGGRGERGANLLAVKNLEAATLDVYAPDGPPERAHRRVDLTPEGAKVEPVSPKNGNYYWVSAREVKDDRISVASSATYFSNPGKAPTQMLLERRNELEIIPQPLPREHGSYRESEKWRFLLRFDGQPLANREVRMETEFGSKSTFTSGPDGLVTVLFPYDFKPEEPGKADDPHRGPRRGRFVLAAEHEADGKHYLTAFNFAYSPDAERGKSLWAGVGFLALGMGLAVPLWRRKAV
ncbi:MAG: hypothetical protein KGZ83_07935 [Sulfuricella sp.]|nr:hypothetical protein [Sulfuricella sp.]